MNKAESEKTTSTSEKNGDIENNQQAHEDKQMIGGCCVCSDDTGYVENLLVYCDGHNCQVAVHQACYGISNVPSGAWYCSRCDYLNSNKYASPKSIQCEFCPYKEGAMKRTDTGKWAHVICALYIPEITFGNNRSMEPIITKNISHERFNKKCSLCELKNDTSSLLNDSTSHLADLGGKSNGVYVNCNKSGCKHWFHVTCAQQAGLLCENDRNSLTYCIYCRFHFSKIPDTTKRIPAFSYKITAHSENKELTRKSKTILNNGKAKKKSRLSANVDVDEETLTNKEEKGTGNKSDKVASLLSKSTIVEKSNENVKLKKLNQSMSSELEQNASNKKSSSLGTKNKNAPTNIESKAELSKKVSSSSSSSISSKVEKTTAKSTAKSLTEKTEPKEPIHQVTVKVEAPESEIRMKQELDQEQDDEKKCSLSPTLAATTSTVTSINFNQQQSTDSGVSCSLVLSDLETASLNLSTIKAQKSKENKGQKRKTRTSSQSSINEKSTNNTTGPMTSKLSASTTNSNQKRVKTSSFELTNSSNLNPLTPPPSVHDIQSSKDPQVQAQHTQVQQTQLSQKEPSMETESHVDVFGNQLNSNVTFASNMLAHKETIKEVQRSVINGSSTNYSILTSNQNKNSELFNQKKNEFKMPNEIGTSTNMIAKSAITNYPTQSVISNSGTLLNGNIPDTLEELLMAQWTLGAELIGEHTQKQMDIIKLLNLLRNCKNENEQLEKSLNELEKRYEYLTDLNHQLNEMEIDKLSNLSSSTSTTNKKNSQQQQQQQGPPTPNKQNPIQPNISATPPKATTTPTKQTQDQTPFLIAASPISPVNSSPRQSRHSTSPSLKTNSTLMEYALSALAAAPSSRQQIQSPLNNPIHHTLNLSNQLLSQSGSTSSVSKPNTFMNNLNANVQQQQQQQYLHSLQNQLNPLQLQYAFIQYLSSSGSNGTPSTSVPLPSVSGLGNGAAGPITSMSTINHPLSAHLHQNHGSPNQTTNFSLATTTTQVANNPNLATVAASNLFSSKNSTSH